MLVRELTEGLLERFHQQQLPAAAAENKVDESSESEPNQ